MNRVTDKELAGMGFEDRFTAVQESWSQTSLAAVKAEMTDMNSFVLSDGTLVNAVVLEPDHNDADETRSLIRSSEFLNGYTPVQYMGAEITRQLVAPNSRMIILPNRSFSQRNHYNEPGILTSQINTQGLKILAEQKVRVLNKLEAHFGLGKVGITGWSLGANMALAIAAVGSDDFEVSHINADEAVSKTGRTDKQLSSPFGGDFVKSGTLGEQRKAIEDSGIPAMSEAFSTPSLVLDYLKFGSATQWGESKAIAKAMTGDVNELVLEALTKYPDLKIKFGHMSGSRIFDPSSVKTEGVALTQYDGETNRRHASVNNPLLQAWMAHDGLTN